MAYSGFTKAIVEGTSIQVFNEGQLERDFTYIDDIVSGVVAAAAFAAVGTVGILTVVRVLTGLRTSAGAERIGIDLIEHAERAYKRDTATFNVGAGS